MSGGFCVIKNLICIIITLVMEMFKIENELKSTNMARTVHFTEPLFEKLNKTAQENDIFFNLLILQCCKYALENMEDNGDT